MKVPLPNLDDRRWADLVDEGRSLIPFYAPDWTDHNIHDPGITFLQTGSEQPGRPSMGSWVSYGLGSENANLPAFVVMISGGEPGDQPLYGRLWGSGFLPGSHAGVKLRGSGDRVLYLANPPGVSREARRRQLDTLGELDRIGQARDGLNLSQ